MTLLQTLNKVVVGFVHEYTYMDNMIQAFALFPCKYNHYSNTKSCIITIRSPQPSTPNFNYWHIFWAFLFVCLFFYPPLWVVDLYSWAP